MTKMKSYSISQISILSLNAWHKFLQHVPPIKAYPGSDDASCKCCLSVIENSVHIMKGCYTTYQKINLIQNRLQLICNSALFEYRNLGFVHDNCGFGLHPNPVTSCITICIL